MVYTSRIRGNACRRPQAFWGALIPAAINFVGGLITSSQQAKAQKRALEEQQRLAQQQLQVSNQNNLATTLNNYASANNSYSDEDYNLKYRNGGTRRLGSNSITITDGGNARKIGNNTYLLRGGSHEDINETGQTGIGINVGGNEIEAEGGEIAQRKGNSLRIYSAQPILGGMSPAQAILRGYNKDKVFNAQQRFKKNNGIKDDGSKAQWGMGAGTNRALQKSTKNGTRSIRSMWNSAKVPLSYMPIAGTIMDGYSLINNPSKTNAVNFGVGLISDLLGYKWLKTTFSTPVRRTVNLSHRGRVPAKVAAGVYSGGADVIDTELNYLQNKKRFGCRVKAKIGTETNENENKTNIITSKLNAAEYLSKIISGSIMQGGRLFTGNNKDRGPVNNVAQDTYLMPFRLGQGRAFKDAGYDRDYKSEKKRDYGLVQKAVGNENIPIYSRVNNPEKRKELIQIYNPESTYNPNIKYPLIHAAFHPSSLYIDGTNGNIMYKGWDLNDYGTDKGGKGFSSYYGSIRKALANTLDVFGNPTVVTTGYQNVLDNNGKPMNIFKGNYKDDYNANMAVSDFIVKQLLKKDNPSFVNEYGMSPISDVVITAPRKKHRFGGGLTSKDRGSSKHPYPSVSSKDFAGGNRSYPIPTKSDAIDALRLAGLHGRSDVRSKVYSKYPELRNKADFGTWVRSNRNNNVLANLLYESGIIDKNAWRSMLRDVHTFTGMGSDPYNDDQDEAVVTPGFGIPNQAQILRNVQQANRVAQSARASQAVQRSSYAAKQAKDFYRGLGINIPIGRNQIYNPTFRSSGLARNIESSNEALRISLNNTHLPKGIKLTPTDQSIIDRTAARIINPREAEIVRTSIPIGQSAKNMTNGANPFLYTSRSSNELLEGLNRFITSAKKEAKSVNQRVGNKLSSSSTYRNPTFAERVRDANGRLIWKQNYKYKPWVKATAGAAGTAGVIGLGIGLSNTNSKYENTKAQLDAKGQPISPYIVRPQEPAKSQTKTVKPTRQVPATIARKDTTRTDTTKQVNKVVKRQVRTTPQYTGNTTKGNYQLHDGETKVINGVKYTRRGNTIINHKTNVGYIYDKNGNYTGQADYSKVGNFNQAFDAARAAGRSQFIYRAGKYNNYSTVKETNAKKEALNRRIGARRIAKRMGGLVLRPKARNGAEIEPYYDWARNTSSNLGISFIDPTYDYRAYYNSVTPYERALIRFAPQGTHFTDIGKTPKHPTFSNESIYSNKKHPGGTWNENVFVPNIWQFGNNGNKVRNKYMNNSGEGYFNGRVNIFPKYRKRIAKRMGCLTNPPVERFKCGGRIRPKAEDGMLAPVYSYGINRRKLPSFAPIDVTPRAIPNFKPVSVPTNTKTPFDPNSVPYLGKQSSFKPTTQDYIGLGIDTLAALGSGMFTRSAYNKMNFDYALPNYVDESPVAFDTIYHNEAQRANVERNRLNSRNLIRDNTSSAQTALGRMQQTDIDAMMELNKLADEKANKEVELRNQNAANEQQVRARNAAARNQYYQNVAQIKNAALEAKNNAALAKAQSIGADLSGLSQAWTNFASSVENRYNTRQNEAIIAATAKDPAVLSNAIQFGYNFSPEILAGVYNSTKDENLKDLVLYQLNNKNRRKYGIK